MVYAFVRELATRTEPRRSRSKESATRYVVAKANSTAVPFVARAEKVRDGWIVLSRHDTYAAALVALARNTTIVSVGAL